MPLSEDEQRILQQIEQQFYEHDPDLAGEMGRPTSHAQQVRNMKLAGFAFVGGLAVVLVALAWEHAFAVALLGLAVMLASAVWFERSLSRVGLDQVTRSLRDRGFGDGLRDATERARDRLRRDED